MSLNPVIYEDNVTVIHAANLNSIQDAILANESAIAGKVSASDYSPTTKTSAMTQAVGKDGNGKLWTEPGGGAGLIIKGYYPTLQSLIANVPHPALGDTYGVGSAAPYEIYMWDGSVWVDNGTIKGEKGDPGEDGEDGFAPAVTITPITGGHRVNITDATHPSGQDFDVMDGAGNVDSVNGQTGTVVLDGADINVDDTAATPQTIKAKIASIDNINTQQSSDIVAIRGNISNRNLLDNAWFTVNQRGVSGSLSKDVYTVDRWKTAIHGGEISYDASTHTLTFTQPSNVNYFIQQIEDSLRNEINGKTVTFSVLEAGSIHSVTFVFDSSKRNYRHDIPNSNFGFWYGENGEICVQHASASTTLSAVKLEIGSISTLAMDTAPNYAEELLKCQRYCLVIGQPTDSYLTIPGIVYSSNKVFVNYPQLNNLRRADNRTISVIPSNPGIGIMYQSDTSGTTSYLVASSMNIEKTGVSFNCTSSILFGRTAFPYIDGTGAICISADL